MCVYSQRIRMAASPAACASCESALMIPQEKRATAAAPAGHPHGHIHDIVHVCVNVCHKDT